MLAVLELEMSSCPHVSLGALSCKKVQVKGIPESVEMSRCWLQCPVTQSMEHSIPHGPLWWPSELSPCHSISFPCAAGHELPLTGSNTGPPTQAQCCWELRCAMDISTVSAPCSVAPVLLLGSFLSLVPGMAARIQDQPLKELSH